MDPMKRVELEVRIDKMLDVKNGEVRSHALQAKEELRAGRWSNATSAIERAEELWKEVRPRRVLDLLVSEGHAKTPSTARQLVEAGRVRVNNVQLRKPFATVGPNDSVSVA